MKKFMDEDFLLDTDTAAHLYHDYAENLPIIDYHCHLSPKEIYEDVRFETISRVWLGADHYKWRQMRWNGVEERYITGDASDREKFQKWAETLEMAIGNPLYHWSHLELNRYFGYRGVLNGDTAEEVWTLCNKRLTDPEMSARNLIRKSKVRVICTTDDPIDSLEWHRKLREEGFEVKVLPTFRPDKAKDMEKPEFAEYIAALSAVAERKITDFESLIGALIRRLDFFRENGCVISDHGLDAIRFEPYTMEIVNGIMRKRLSGGEISEKELCQYKTAFLIAMGREYAKRSLVMQLHFGVQRDLNRAVYQTLGPDAGIDAIGNFTSPVELGKFLNRLKEENLLPKTILYSLNPADNAMIDTVAGCFQGGNCPGWIQHGAAWWFQDHKQGMTEQMTSLANLGLLGRFVGMLTDSRSFLSYTRHEYFRRILCQMLGAWVENGEYPADEKSLKKIVEGISYWNVKEYLGL